MNPWCWCLVRYGVLASSTLTMLYAIRFAFLWLR